MKTTCLALVLAFSANAYATAPSLTLGASANFMMMDYGPFQNQGLGFGGGLHADYFLTDTWSAGISVDALTGYEKTTGSTVDFETTHFSVMARPEYHFHFTDFTVPVGPMAGFDVRYSSPSQSQVLPAVGARAGIDYRLRSDFSLGLVAEFMHMFAGGDATNYRTGLMLIGKWWI